jgi:MinD-like ATPase involved in chromosome partitioning or flagellar assembly
MYVVTFYSFKGGVGRTSALVNAGLELALSGRRVLLVDFDLEAPGLDTFNLPRPKNPAQGIVDYVHRYLETGMAPDIEDYVYRSPAPGTERGQLSIMPSGKQDDLYETRLNSISWQELYAERDGYLLFENLKAQWLKFLAPDYVLVDSRSGHTDVGGICTRQLPDAVVLLFFPNEQNRRGLEKVVRQIRQEKHGPRQKEIQLHFVMSNIPDLDDEEEILAGSLDRMKGSLEYEQLTATIHHYDSLNLLNQSVFVLERPKSRLTREYQELVQRIKRGNVEDRDGALEFLTEVLRSRRSRTEFPIATLEERLEDIREKHWADGEILRTLAGVRRRQGRMEEAISLLDQASEGGVLDGQLLLARAEIHAAMQNRDGAVTDVRRLLEMSEVGYFEVSNAVRLLRDLDEKALIEVPSSRALRSLRMDGQLAVATELMFSREALVAAEQILRQLSHNGRSSPNHLATIRIQLSICLIGQGRFNEAREVISPKRPDPSELAVQDAFNYAIAEWGETRVIPKDLFDRVVALDSLARKNTANYNQCLAIALWAVGGKEQAEQRIREVRQQMMTWPRHEFSGWRYLQVSPEDFLQDLDAMERMVAGERIEPTVFSEGRLSRKGALK